MPLYELGQAILIVVAACVTLYMLRKPLARLFGTTERKASDAHEEVKQAYHEGMEIPTPKEDKIGENE